MTKTFLRIGNDSLDEAIPFSSKAKAIAHYRDVAADLYRFGQSIDATLHYADNVEELAEYPDIVLTYDGRVHQESA